MTLEHRAVGSEVFLSGTIDEHTSFKETSRILDAHKGEPLTLNLGGILRINSLGVRSWIPFITQLTRARQVRISAMSYPLVMQANMLANLMASARIVSCMAPYFCGICQANRMMLVTVEEVGVNKPAPPRACPDCGTAMEFDELESYFNFLARTP